MTKEKAIEELIFLLAAQQPRGSEKTKAIRIAIDALKRQVPKRVIEPQNEYICKCPTCGCDVLDCDYCKHCGQRLDWWDEK